MAGSGGINGGIYGKGGMWLYFKIRTVDDVTQIANVPEILSDRRFSRGGYRRRCHTAADRRKRIIGIKRTVCGERIGCCSPFRQRNGLRGVDGKCQRVVWIGCEKNIHIIKGHGSMKNKMHIGSEMFIRPCGQRVRGMDDHIQVFYLLGIAGIHNMDAMCLGEINRRDIG